jgi:hypothetical protein
VDNANVDHVWQEKLFCSLRFKKEMLDAIYEWLVTAGSDLVPFLQDSDFKIRICRALSRVVVGHVKTDIEGVKTELKIFLAKAESFKDEHKEYSAWWPAPDREGIMRQACSNILLGDSCSPACFTCIVGTVTEALEAIEIWEVPRREF